jgi:hypothetical protein
VRIDLYPPLAAARSVTCESLALARWYDGQPAVRRLWGIQCGGQLRVIVAIEPTHDGDDVFPLWFANADAWTRELILRTGLQVRLELVHELPSSVLEVDGDGVVIVDLFWRDATLNRPHEVL